MLVDFKSSDTQAENLLKVVSLCYEYAYLNGREELGLRLNDTERSRLRWLRHLLESGGKPSERRRHRRMPVAIPVLLRTAAGPRRGMLLNVSGSGMFVATDDPIEFGESVQVRVGGQVEYSFPCEVRWTSGPRGVPGIGLRLSGIPVEVRRGARSGRSSGELAV